MVKYIVKRFIALIPVLLGVTLIIFTLLYFTPGDPAQIMLGDEAATPGAIAQIHEELGLDDPFWVRYGNYVLDLLHGDLGVSYLNKRPVAEMLIERLPKTMTLACVSAALAIVLGVTFGVIAAVKHNSIFDNLCMIFAPVSYTHLPVMERFSPCFPETTASFRALSCMLTSMIRWLPWIRMAPSSRCLRRAGNS